MKSAALPLSGRRIVITRSRSQSPEFRSMLEAAGATVLELPAIEIRPRFSPELDKAIYDLEDFDWLIFTSSNSVVIFFDQLLRLRPDVARLGFQKPRVCAIGPATAQKIQDFGQTVSLVPAVFQAEGILEEFVRTNGAKIEGLKVLLPRAAKARELLPEELRKRGVAVELIPVYDTVIPQSSATTIEQVLQESPDIVCFTSSSTVNHFVQMSGNSDIARFTYAAIGPITAATARDHGLSVAVQPSEWTVPALVKAIVEHFGAKAK